MKQLRESATIDLTGSKVRIRLINEGQGASGFYKPEVLESCGPKAFPKGTFLFYNHVQPEDRDIRDAFGVLEEDASFEKDTAALWSDALIFEEHRERVKALAPHVGMSIEAAGDTDADGNVTIIEESPYNAVAMVHRPGRGGAIAAILESAKISGSNNNQREDAGMTPEEIEKLATALAEKMSGSISNAITEALKPAPEPEGEKDAVDPLVVAEALTDVPKVARARILESIKNGAELTAAIEAEKAYIAEIGKSDDAEDGRLGERAKIDPKPMTVRGW